jgi:voltage-gated potassium channel
VFKYYERYKAQIDLVLSLVSLAFLVSWGVGVLMPDLADSEWMKAFEYACYLVFSIDLVFRVGIFCMAEKELRSFRRFVVEISIPALALAAPALRSLRLFRVLLALRSVSTLLRTKAERAGLVVLTAYPSILLFGAIAVLDAERNVPQATIRTFKDAIWWALATSTTVGDGALYPVSDDAKLMASLLMFAGVISFSTITAIVSSWVISSNQAQKPESHQK